MPRADAKCIAPGFPPARERRHSRAGGIAGANGFTLLEVLIALLLMSLALTGLMRLSTLEARAAAQLRDATFAQWVAANALAETRLREGFPAVGTRDGQSAMAGRQWRWRLDVSGTEETSIRRLDITVYAPDSDNRHDDEEGSVAVLTGFATQP
jgi:general secretion pathway protein I